MENLEVAWIFRTDNFGPEPEIKGETTPIFIDGVLYATAGLTRSIVAIDPGSGELLWMYRLDEGERGAKAPRRFSGRGVASWSDGDKDRRIYFVTIGYQLVALDAITGHPIGAFGVDGVVDLMRDVAGDVDPVGCHRIELSARGCGRRRHRWAGLPPGLPPTGEHLWMQPNGDTPAWIRDHPALEGVDVGRTGSPSRAGILVTKTLVLAGEGWGGGRGFYAYDKRTGEVLARIELPGVQTGVPMSYHHEGRQYVVVSVGDPATRTPAQLVALALPRSD